MSNWFQILREQLQLPNIAADGTAVPFGITGIAPRGLACGRIRERR